MTKREIAALRTLYRRLGGGTGRPDGPMSFSAEEITVTLTKNGQKINPSVYVNEATELWRKTYILPVLRALINKANKCATAEDMGAIDFAARD